MVDAQYPINNTDASIDWSVIIAEKLDSSGGSAGDEVTTNITATSPTNQFIQLRLPEVNELLKSMDKTQHIAGNVHLTTILGQIGKSFALKNIWIKNKKISEMNALRKTLEKWMTSGNAQAGTSSLYMAIKGDEGGSDRYFVFSVDGAIQNWARIKINDVANVIKYSMFKTTLKLEFSEN